MNFITKIKNLFGAIRSRGKEKEEAKDVFNKMLDSLSIYHDLKTYLLSELNKYLTHFDANAMEKDDLYKFMWLIIYMYYESIVTAQKLDIFENAIIYGLPGSGKTAFICSIIEESNNAIEKIYCDYNSELLYKSICPEVIITPTLSNASIIETSDINIVMQALQEKPNLQVYLIIDSQANISALLNMKMELHKLNIKTIGGIVITKKDCIGELAAISSAAHIFSSKLVAATQYELRDSKRGFVPTENLIELLLKRIAGDKVNATQLSDEIYQLINKKQFSLQAYQSFLKCINAMDSDKLKSMMMAFGGAASKMGSIGKIADVANAYKTIQSQLNEAKMKEMVALMSKQVYIIDSMTKKERKNPNMVGVERAVTIAYGSGTTKENVFYTIQSFYSYKEMMKDVDYLKIIEALKHD